MFIASRATNRSAPAERNVPLPIKSTQLPFAPLEGGGSMAPQVYKHWAPPELKKELKTKDSESKTKGQRTKYKVQRPQTQDPRPKPAS